MREGERDEVVCLERGRESNAVVAVVDAADDAVDEVDDCDDDGVDIIIFVFAELP